MLVLGGTYRKSEVKLYCGRKVPFREIFWLGRGLFDVRGLGNDSWLGLSSVCPGGRVGRNRCFRVRAVTAKDRIAAHAPMRDSLTGGQGRSRNVRCDGGGFSHARELAEWAVQCHPGNSAAWFQIALCHFGSLTVFWISLGSYRSPLFHIPHKVAANARATFRLAGEICPPSMSHN